MTRMITSPTPSRENHQLSTAFKPNSNPSHSLSLSFSLYFSLSLLGYLLFWFFHSFFSPYLIHSSLFSDSFTLKFSFLLQLFLFIVWLLFFDLDRWWPLWSLEVLAREVGRRVLWMEMGDSRSRNKVCRAALVIVVLRFTRFIILLFWFCFAFIYASTLWKCGEKEFWYLGAN